MADKNSWLTLQKIVGKSFTAEELWGWMYNDSGDRIARLKARGN